VNRRPGTAVLLAAGRGDRLRPATDTTPKPLLPVGGRPVLDYVLTAVRLAGIGQVIVVTGHLGEQVEAYVGDGSAWGVRAVCCRQPYLGGTAHALATAATAYPALFDRERPFLLAATDYALPPGALAELVAEHTAGDADLTVSVKRLPPEAIRGRSSAVLDDDGRLVRIIEKPGPDEARGPLAAALLFVLPAAALDYLAAVEPSPRGEAEIQSVINRLLEDGYVAGVVEQEASPEPTVAA
jgi:NDP-sugar pyrophosphorylase family protein